MAHHKVYITPTNINDPNITLNWDNLEALCQECHNKEHSAKAPVADGLMFDENGNLMQTENIPPSRGMNERLGYRLRDLRKPRPGRMREGG